MEGFDAVNVGQPTGIVTHCRNWCSERIMGDLCRFSKRSTMYPIGFGWVNSYTLPIQCSPRREV